MFFKKFFFIVFQLLVVSTILTANDCPKWLPMPYEDGLHIVIPIYDESITGADMDCDEILDSIDTDIDGDGVSNAVENTNGTNPLNADTDGDGVSDGNDVAPLNKKPIADSFGIGVTEDHSVNLTLRGADAEGDTLTFSTARVPAHGILSGTAPHLVYTPNLNYNGLDSFTYRAYDGFDYSVTATVTIGVIAVNDAPNANNFTMILDINASTVVANWESSAAVNDPEGGTVTATIVGQGTNGTCSLSGHNVAYFRTSEADIANYVDHCTLSMSDGDASRIVIVSIDALYWKQVATNDKNSCGIKSDGTLWCWGYNFFGQLGDNTYRGRSSDPVQEDHGYSDWKQVSVGSDYTVAIRNNGTLWSWGINASGQLGINNTQLKRVPTQEYTESSNWKSVVAGSSYTVGIKEDGTLWSWGKNNYGQLGVNDRTRRYIPTQEYHAFTNWETVDTGSGHTVAIRSDHSLWSWGANYYGQLGVNDTTERIIPVQEHSAYMGWESVSAGVAYSVAIKANHTLYGWGSNGNGQLGSTDRHYKTVPTIESTHASDWSSVNAGGYHTIALKTNGTLFAWGRNEHGQVGNNTLGTDILSPVQEATLSTDWKSISAGEEHTLTLKNNGRLWAWGADYFAKLGDRTPINRLVPTHLRTPISNWIMVASGVNHTVALLNDGTIWSWGENYNGQLGDATNLDRDMPVQESTHATNWRYIAVGDNHTVALKYNNTLWSWGKNSNGQLGKGSMGNSSNIPVQENSSSTKWMRISAGECHTVALKDNHSLWAWGCNDKGQLGINSTVDKDEPTHEYTSATDWLDLSVGSKHSVAIKTDGTLWSWGYNSNGQLGLGDTNNRIIPQKEHTNATNWVSISAGSAHTIALKGSHALWGWGSNQSGQLGIDDTHMQTMPIRESTLSNDWEFVSSGGRHTVAIKTDGSLWAWGANYMGELGVGILGTKYTVPTLINNSIQWGYVSAGYNYNIAIGAVTTALWGWGDNSKGTLATDWLIFKNPKESVMRQ